MNNTINKMLSFSSNSDNDKKLTYEELDFFNKNEITSDNCIKNVAGILSNLYLLFISRPFSNIGIFYSMIFAICIL